jgi:uncharacterized protein with HEPN domain
MQQFRSPRNLELDPKDEKVSIEFRSEFALQLAQRNSKELPIEDLEDDLRDWLVDVVEITTSIGFNHLNKGTLTEKETKNFVAKNVLENIKKVFENFGEFPLDIRFRLM